ncbi:hypothetical protein OF83DRAFT_1173510 [Amylostereum chailletii]|nr:hypothetical protein OF83DRAFT_1173510 [Amylostereum chailletii]
MADVRALQPPVAYEDQRAWSPKPCSASVSVTRKVDHPTQAVDGSSRFPRHAISLPLPSTLRALRVGFVHSVVPVVFVTHDAVDSVNIPSHLSIVPPPPMGPHPPSTTPPGARSKRRLMPNRTMDSSFTRPEFLILVPSRCLPPVRPSPPSERQKPPSTSKKFFKPPHQLLRRMHTSQPLPVHAQKSAPTSALCRRNGIEILRPQVPDVFVERGAPSEVHPRQRPPALRRKLKYVAVDETSSVSLQAESRCTPRLPQPQPLQKPACDRPANDSVPMHPRAGLLPPLIRDKISHPPKAVASTVVPDVLPAIPLHLLPHRLRSMRQTKRKNKKKSRKAKTVYLPSPLKKERSEDDLRKEAEEFDDVILEYKRNQEIIAKRLNLADAMVAIKAMQTRTQPTVEVQDQEVYRDCDGWFFI